MNAADFFLSMRHLCVPLQGGYGPGGDADGRRRQDATSDTPNGLRHNEVVFVLCTKEEEELYIQLWPTAFFYRLFDKHATAPSEDALRQLLARPAPLADSGRDDGQFPSTEALRRIHANEDTRQRTEHIRTITVEPEVGRTDPLRTCSNRQCGREYLGSRRSGCTYCGWVTGH